MASTQAESSILARTPLVVALLAFAAACVFFALSTAPAADPTGIAAGQAASLSLPAWITAGLALLGAVILLLLLVLLLGGSETTACRAGGLLGMSAAVGAAAGGLLNLIGYASSNIWWAADPAAMRTAAGVPLVVALVGLAAVASDK